MKRVLSLILALSVTVLAFSVITPLNASAEVVTVPSPENTKFLYDKIVLDNSKETNYSVATEKAGDVAFEYKQDAIVKNGEFNGISGWTSEACPTTGGVATLLLNYHLTQVVALEKNTDYQISFDIKNTDNNWLVFRVRGADSTNLVNQSQSGFGKNGWIRTTFSFNSGENNSATIDFCNTSGNTMQIDNVSIGKTLIRNASFENGNQGDWVYQLSETGNTYNATSGSDGKNSAVIRSYYWYQQLVTVEKNTDYTLSFDVLAPDGYSGWMMVGVYAKDTSKTGHRGTQLVRGNGLCSGATVWTKKYLSFNSGENTEVVIGITEDGGTTGRIDNFALEKTPIVKNGSFESGTSNWVIGETYNTVDSVTSTHGSRSLVLKRGWHSKQAVNVEKNSEYSLSFDVYTPADAICWTSVYILGVNDDSTTTQIHNKGGMRSSTADTWSRITTTFTTNDYNRIIIDFIDTHDNSTGNTRVDNVKLELLPILKNGSFKNGFSYWTSGSNTLNTTDSSDGANSANLVKWVHLKQSVKVQKYTFYKLSFDVKNEEEVWAKATIQDSSDITFSSTQLFSHGNSGWENVEVVINSNENTALTLDFCADSDEGILIDNVKLEQLKKEMAWKSITGNTIPIVPDRYYNFKIAWQYADESDSGEFEISGRARDFGDVNGDSIVNIADLVRIKKKIDESSKELEYDLSDEGKVNDDDYSIMRSVILGQFIIPEIVYASRNGVFPNSGTDMSSPLQNLISSKNNALIILDEGRYVIDSSIRLSNLNNVSIKAYGAEFITSFNPSNPLAYEAGFVFENCENCKIYGASVETSKPASIKARIVEKRTLSGDDQIVIEIEDGLKFNGNEKIMGIASLNEDLSPNGHISFVADTNSGYEYEMESDNRVVIRVWKSLEQHLDDVAIGELVALRYSLYSTSPLKFYGCNNMLLEDVTVKSSPGVACEVYDRSANFTFCRFNVGTNDTAETAYSANADGIHIKGLSGKLVLDDCHFYNMGDDALNIHTPAGNVDKVNGSVVTVSGFDVKAGDLVYAYDAQTLQKTAEFIVNNVVTGQTEGSKELNCSIVSGAITQGNKLALAKLSPQVKISNCSVTNGHARGFLIQVSNVTVEDCQFKGINSAGLMLACDVNAYNELGPVSHAIVRNNVFENCGSNFNLQSAGGIIINSSHSDDPSGFTARNTIHSNITLSGNTFRNLQDSAIFANAVNGITIRNNTFSNCCYDATNRTSDYKKTIVLFNCGNVVTENNGAATITNK